MGEVLCSGSQRFRYLAVSTAVTIHIYIYICVRFRGEAVDTAAGKKKNPPPHGGGGAGGGGSAWHGNALAAAMPLAMSTQ